MTAAVGEPHVGLVVEGAGDRGALPIILRMHLQQQGEYRDVLGEVVPVFVELEVAVPRLMPASR